jgi:hypothetical protein
MHDSHVSLQRRQRPDERAALQIVRNGEMWDKGCTNPSQRRAPQRKEIVRVQARQVNQLGGLVIHSDEVPGRVLVGASHRKRRHSSNILERLWFAVRGNAFGTGDEDHLVRPEHAHGDIGILQWWLAYPHRDVETFVDDVDTPIGSVERDAHARMLCDLLRTWLDRVRGRIFAFFSVIVYALLPLSLLYIAIAADERPQLEMVLTQGLTADATIDRVDINETRWGLRAVSIARVSLLRSICSGPGETSPIASVRQCVAYNAGQL